MPLQAGNNSQIPQSFSLPNQIFNAPAYASGYMYIQPKSSPVLAYQVILNTWQTNTPMCASRVSSRGLHFSAP